MGSGGMIVMDETTGMVDVARFFMEFCMDESCGKCVPCRAGTVQIHHLLQKILARQATPSDVKQLEALCLMVKQTSLCGLGQTAPNPVLSTLRFFRPEYEALLQADWKTPDRPDQRSVQTPAPPADCKSALRAPNL
jgi:bidirectional [NiFe] hydrogenase diaphorase subunit